MSTILVTGAAGYIGGALTRRLLSAGHSVIGYDACAMPHGNSGVRDLPADDRFELVVADVRDTAALEATVPRADAVVHLAAIVGDPACKRDPELTRAVNVEASRDLIGLARRNGVEHFVFVSTCSNYGQTGTDDLVAEDAELNPISLYAESKVEVERALSGQADLPATVLRLATVYGVAPRMRFDLTVNQFTAEAELERRLAIYGGQFWRPYVNVEDVAMAIERVLDRPESSVGETFNVGHSDENYTKRMLNDLLADRVEDLTTDWVEIEEDPRSYKVSFAKIAERLDFTPAWRVPEGMEALLERIRAEQYADYGAAHYRN